MCKDTGIQGFTPIFQDTFNQTAGTKETDDIKYVFVQDGRLWMTTDKDKVDTVNTLEALRKEIMATYGSAANEYITDGKQQILTLGDARTYFNEIADKLKQDGLKPRNETMTEIEHRYGEAVRKEVEQLPHFQLYSSQDLLGLAKQFAFKSLLDEIKPLHYKSRSSDNQKSDQMHLPSDDQFKLAFEDACEKNGPVKDNILRHWTENCHPQIKEMLSEILKGSPEQTKNRILDQIRPLVEAMLNGLEKNVTEFTEEEMDAFKTVAERSKLETNLLEKYGEHIGNDAIKQLNPAGPRNEEEIDDDNDDVISEADYTLEHLESGLNRKLGEVKTLIADTYGQEIADAMETKLQQILDERIKDKNPSIEDVRQDLLDQAKSLFETALSDIRKDLDDASSSIDINRPVSIAKRWLGLTFPDLKKPMDDLGDDWAKKCYLFYIPYINQAIKNGASRFVSDPLLKADIHKVRMIVAEIIEKTLNDTYGIHISQKSIKWMYDDNSIQGKTYTDLLKICSQKAETMSLNLKSTIIQQLKTIRNTISYTYGRNVANDMLNDLNSVLHDKIKEKNPDIDNVLKERILRMAETRYQDKLHDFKKNFEDADNEKKIDELVMDWLGFTAPDLKKTLDEFGSTLPGDGTTIKNEVLKELKVTIRHIATNTAEKLDLQSTEWKQFKTLVTDTISKAQRKSIEIDLKKDFGEDLGNDAIEHLNQLVPEGELVNPAHLKSVKQAITAACDDVAGDAEAKLPVWKQDIQSKFPKLSAELIQPMLDEVRSEHVTKNTPLTLADKERLMERASHLADYVNMRAELIRDYGQRIAEMEFPSDNEKTTLLNLLEAHKSPGNPLTLEKMSELRSLADELVRKTYDPLFEQLPKDYDEKVPNYLRELVIERNIKQHIPMDDKIEKEIRDKAYSANDFLQDLNDFTENAIVIDDDVKTDIVKYLFSHANPLSNDTFWNAVLIDKACKIQLYKNYIIEKHNNNKFNKLFNLLIHKRINQTLNESVDPKKFDDTTNSNITDLNSIQSSVKDDIKNLQSVVISAASQSVVNEFGAEVAALPFVLKEIAQAAKLKAPTIPTETMDALRKIKRYANEQGLDADKLIVDVCQAADRYSRLAMEQDRDWNIRTSHHQSMLRSLQAIAGNETLLRQAVTHFELTPDQAKDGARWIMDDLAISFREESKVGIKTGGGTGFTPDDLGMNSFADLRRAETAWGTKNMSPLIFNGRTMPNCRTEQEEKAYYRNFQNQLLPRSCDPQIRRFVSFCIMQGGIQYSLMAYWNGIAPEHHSSIAPELKRDYDFTKYGHLQRVFKVEKNILHFTTKMMAKITSETIPGTTYDAPFLDIRPDSYLGLHTWTVDLSIDLSQKVEGKDGIPDYTLKLKHDSNDVWKDIVQSA